MVGLRRGLGTSAGRKADRLLAEVAPVRRSGGADRLAEGLGSEMAIALLDRDRIGVNDEIACFVPLGVRERVSRRLRIGQHRGAVEILAPGLVGGLKDDDAVGQTVGGDHVGHLALTGRAPSARRRLASIFNDSILCVCIRYNSFALFLRAGLPGGKDVQAQPSKSKQKCLVLLGFIRPNRDFSIGCGGKNKKNPLPPLSPPSLGRAASREARTRSDPQQRI